MELQEASTHLLAQTHLSSLTNMNRVKPARQTESTAKRIDSRGTFSHSWWVLSFARAGPGGELSGCKSCYRVRVQGRSPRLCAYLKVALGSCICWHMGLHLCRNRCAGGGRKEVLDSVALAQQVIPLQCLALSRVANSSQGFRCRGQRAATCDVWQCPGGEFPVPNPSVYASSEIDGNQDTAQQQGGPTERPQRAGQQRKLWQMQTRFTPRHASLHELLALFHCFP